MKPRKVNVSIGSCQHSLFKQHLFIVKRNFARGPVELETSECEKSTVPYRRSHWPCLSQHTQSSLKELYGAYCTGRSTVATTPTLLYALCVWLGWGSGRLGAGGLLNFSISGSKDPSSARPAHTRPLPYFG